MQIRHWKQNLHKKMKYLKRVREGDLAAFLRESPVVAVLGPRQCGKSTLIRHLAEKRKSPVFLDLERPSDLAKLADPEFFLSRCRGRLVCIDEIQLRPDLFPILRTLCDVDHHAGQFLISGSATHDLVQRSAESLAGRIYYLRLTPFLYEELGNPSLERYLLRGGFPLSFGAKDDRAAFRWIDNFIVTFLERDLRFWQNVPPETMRRLWKMLAHENGQTINYSRLGSSLGVADTTVRRYVDLLKDTYMVEQIPPYFSNLKKRLVKAPKVYLSDSGITNALLGVTSFDELYSHSTYGACWEQMVLANIRGVCPTAEIYFYRDSNGNEIDFIVKNGAQVVAVECKCSTAPSVERGTYAALDDVQPSKAIVVAPVQEGYPLNERVSVVGLSGLADEFTI